MTGTVWPVGPAGGSVANLPPDVGKAWQEARTAHAVAAYTASEIMCRKILMHLAVDAAASAPGRSFTQYIDDLDGAGYIAPSLKPSVDKIRVRGNAANHDLPASTEADSLVTLRLTEFLLRGIYEIPSAEGAAATTLQGVATYSPVPSGRSVIETTVPVGKPATDEEIDALRRRLRGE